MSLWPTACLRTRLSIHQVRPRVIPKPRAFRGVRDLLFRLPRDRSTQSRRLFLVCTARPNLAHPHRRRKLNPNMPKTSSIVPGGAALFQRMFTRLNCDGRPPRFRVEFYPYSSLVLTIRRREETVFVRLSDLLQRAPLPVIEGAAALLISRVYRRRAPRELTAPYLEYAKSNRTRARINSMRSHRVRPGASEPQGRHFDLTKLFDELNGNISTEPAQAPAHRLEQSHLAAPIRMLRPRSQSHSVESPHGSSGRAALRRRVRPLPRNAARQASHAPLGLQPRLSLPGISRRRKTIPRIRSRPQNSRPPSLQVAQALLPVLRRPQWWSGAKTRSRILTARIFRRRSVARM